ncbi:unnamed protein product, partial [Sphagnum troendelagicum]
MGVSQCTLSPPVFNYIGFAKKQQLPYFVFPAYSSLLSPSPQAPRRPTSFFNSSQDVRLHCNTQVSHPHAAFSSSSSSSSCCTTWNRTSRVFGWTSDFQGFIADQLLLVADSLSVKKLQEEAMDLEELMISGLCAGDRDGGSTGGSDDGWSGGGGGGGGGRSGDHHSGDGENPGDGGESWSWITGMGVVLMMSSSSLLSTKACNAFVLEETASCRSTRQTYAGEVAVRYAQAVREACEEHGYKFYDEPYMLNIIGVRNPTDEPGAFDDHLSVVYCTGGGFGRHTGLKPQHHEWVVTTYTASVDPGRAWLTMGWGGVGGTAILCPGQYMDAYEVGLHNAKYEALLQRLPVKVWRDNDCDGKLDFGTDGVYDDEGVFGINIHHAGIKDAAEYNLLLTKYTDMVEKYSAGCQVIATIDDFKHFMELVKLSIMKTKKPYFTYTLFQGNKTWNSINAPLQMALLEKTNNKKCNLV